MLRSTRLSNNKLFVPAPHVTDITLLHVLKCVLTKDPDLKLTFHRFAFHPNDEPILESFLFFSVPSRFVLLVVEVCFQLPLVLLSCRVLLVFSVFVWFLRLVPWLTFSFPISHFLFMDIPIYLVHCPFLHPSLRLFVRCEALNQRPYLREALQSTRRVQLH